MRVVIFGPSGQLGRSLIASTPNSIRLDPIDRKQVELSDFRSIESRIYNSKPQYIINAAAYTNVDGAESDRDMAFRINSEAITCIAQAARRVGSFVIHISTDFVFDGESTEPYVPADVADPKTVYGASKLQGEQSLRTLIPQSSTVIRTSWLYSPFGHNFIKTMLQLMESRESISVVDDQVGCPTCAASVANAVWAAVGTNRSPGVFHWTDKGAVSWYDFAHAIQNVALEIGLLHKRIPIHSIKSDEYRGIARRPKYSVLDCSETAAVFGIRQTGWLVSLRRTLLSIKDK